MLVPALRLDSNVPRGDGSRKRCRHHFLLVRGRMLESSAIVDVVPIVLVVAIVDLKAFDVLITTIFTPLRENADNLFCPTQIQRHVLMYVQMLGRPPLGRMYG